METYLVGGAVRDELLGLTVRERDWVVVGSSVSEMEARGFTQVGKDFPVFLHPESKEEYALARIERKIAAGHQGFECDASNSVTLEEDLLRRDLTINAIAKTSNDEYVDPYKGVTDLRAKVLRHVSPAFSEDPLRVLRLARFYARFAEFTVAEETIRLATQMVAENELAELAAERIWMEVQKALETDHPHRFFELLITLGAQRKLMPSISESQVALLAKAEADLRAPEQRFAILCWDPASNLGRAQAGETKSNLKQELTRLKLPKRFLDLALTTARYQNEMLRTPASADDAVDLLYRLDAFRRSDRVQLLADQSKLLMQLRGTEPPIDWFELFTEANKVNADQIDRTLKGPAFGEALRAARRDQLANFLSR